MAVPEQEKAEQEKAVTEKAIVCSDTMAEFEPEQEKAVTEQEIVCSDTMAEPEQEKAVTEEEIVCSDTMAEPEQEKSVTEQEIVCSDTMADPEQEKAVTEQEILCSDTMAEPEQEKAVTEQEIVCSDTMAEPEQEKAVTEQEIVCSDTMAEPEQEKAVTEQEIVCSDTMAEPEQEKAVTQMSETHEILSSMLCNKERDFLIKNNGETVKVEELEGKYVGLYFSAHRCPPGRDFTSVLSTTYKKLLEKGDFEIVFISADRDEKSFEEYHHTMPWLAVPFSDENTRKNLDEKFQVNGIPYLVILDKKREVITPKGVEIIKEFDFEAYPFTTERLDELRAKEEALRAAQTVESLLRSDERDFVIGHGGRKVPVAELTGKTVGLYFSAHWYGPCRSFTPQLVDIYNELLKRGEDFEIVFLSRDKEEKTFEEYYASMPWLALPFGDINGKKLSRFFEVSGIPTLIILGPDGKTVQTDAVSHIRDYGIRAYPFTKDRLDEVEAEDNAKREAQTLESLLVSDARNFVIKHGDAQVLVSELVGKTVSLYFSARWCPPCKSFTPELIKVYNELKERGEDFEIVFISMDRDQEAFEDYYKDMPWLALPFGDKTKKDLSRYFRVRGIPSLIVVGPDGKTVTKNARSAVSTHGARAYPFTDAHFQRLQKEMKELVDKSPKEIKYSQHEHQLVLTQRPVFVCDGCNKDGSAWSYYCKKCDYDLHVECGLKDQQDQVNQEKGQDTDTVVDENCKPAGVICDGDVCYRA